jgi:rhodanese-related sulfurtransferase
LTGWFLATTPFSTFLENVMNKRTYLKWAAAFTLSAVLSAPVWASDTPATLAGTKLINAADVKKMIDSGVVVIDTRVASEFAEKTIKGAKNVPYKEKSAKDIGFDATQDQFDLSKLPADKSAPLVLFCNSGECWKSYKAAVVAQKAGYSKIQWFRGGMPEWVKAGLPTQ